MKRHFTLIFATCAFLMATVAAVIVRVSLCTSIIDPYIGRTGGMNLQLTNS